MTKIKNICIPHSLFSKKKKEKKEIAQYLAFLPKVSETNLFLLWPNPNFCEGCSTLTRAELWYGKFANISGTV